MIRNLETRHVVHLYLQSMIKMDNMTASHRHLVDGRSTGHKAHLLHVGWRDMVQTKRVKCHDWQLRLTRECMAPHQTSTLQDGGWSSQSGGGGGLSTDGRVYTWGQDSRGQLGLGQGKSFANSPQQLRPLSSTPLVHVAAGGEQSFALSVSGGVFGWGRNDRGQLGLGDTTGALPLCIVLCLYT